jgi:hypothetical protein
MGRVCEYAGVVVARVRGREDLRVRVRVLQNKHFLSTIVQGLVHQSI